MKKSYNLLREPWIPVADHHGESRFMGIMEVLEQAPQLRGIVDASPLVEYGLYRLLVVFIMDALRPEEIFDLEDLLTEARFDMQRIHAYISRCESEGCSFDLLDEKRPFLQAPYDPAWDKEKKPATYLDCRVPNGNNHVHFTHGRSKQFLSYGEAARLLPTCSLFATAMTQGYPSSINAAPPYFALLKGKNLFETLVNMMLPMDEIADFDSVPVFWRCGDIVEPKKQVGKTSWLYGMLFPARRVLLLPEEKGIGEIYLGQGLNFYDPGNWTDPHVTYRFGKNGRFPWRPDGERPVWRNLNDLIDIKDKHAPQVLGLFQRLHGDGSAYVHICLYGVQTSQASYLDLFYHDFQLPVILLQEERPKLVEQCIGEAETLAKNLARSLAGTGVSNHMVQEAVQACYQACESALWELCGTELAQAQVDGAAAISHWKERLSHIGRRVCEQAIERLGLTGKEWVQLYQKQAKWYLYLTTLQKGGE